MYLQESEVLRRQRNRRSRGIDRHKQPELVHLSDALRNASKARQRLLGNGGTRVPVLCRWQVHQMCYCGRGSNEATKAKRYERLKDHLSYGGRVTLRRCPFFMPSSVGCLGISSQARKDKQANTGLRPSFHCVCLLGRARSASQRELHGVHPKLEKTSKLNFPFLIQSIGHRFFF